MIASNTSSFRHGTVPRAGILLVNLGTPDAPTPKAVRRYLKEFLSDPRVVEIPRLLWWPILNGIILNVRPRQSARKYASVWTTEGSPLRVHTERQAKLVKGFLSERVRSPFTVAWGMRYGSPSLCDGLTELRNAGCDRIVVVPLYPQYAASTTATAYDEIARVMGEQRNLPELRTVRSFHRHPGYIAALADSVRQHWAQNGRGDTLLMSFHGLPRYTLEKGDPYFCECHVTGRLLAEALELEDGAWRLSFQSRFGKTEWLRPYTVEVLAELARGGRKIDVICPGFVADCLETLEEIGIEGRELFLSAGGSSYSLIPCLNENEAWISALTDLVREHAGSWLADSWDEAAAIEAARQSREHATALGGP